MENACLLLKGLDVADGMKSHGKLIDDEELEDVSS